jgi:hypothetical protein
MPTGVGATTLVNDPRAQGVNFAPDPAAFFELTEKNEYTPLSEAAPGSGSSVTKQLPQAGILSGLKILFVGTITTTLGGGTVTTTSRWPYGFLEKATLSANAQNDLISVNGCDLHVLRAIRNPGFVPNDDIDLVPGGIGAGQVLADGANEVVLGWEIPVAIDPVSLIGSLYAQSPSMNLQLSLRQAVTTDLLVAGGAATIDSITGTFYVMVTSFDIPITTGEQPRLITPDLSRLHGVQSHAVPYSNTGEVRAPMIRVNGQLDRLLVNVSQQDPAGEVTDQFLSATADADEIDAIRIEYGAAERPLDYNPAHFLAWKNLDHYADSLPYEYLAFDFLAENAPRDVILMTGVTDLVTVPTVNSGVTVGSGAAVRLVQETLFA